MTNLGLHTRQLCSLSKTIEVLGQLQPELLSLGMLHWRYKNKYHLRWLSSQRYHNRDIQLLIYLELFQHHILCNLLQDRLLHNQIYKCRSGQHYLQFNRFHSFCTRKQWYRSIDLRYTQVFLRRMTWCKGNSGPNTRQEIRKFFAF